MPPQSLQRLSPSSARPCPDERNTLLWRLLGIFEPSPKRSSYIIGITAYFPSAQGTPQTKVKATASIHSIPTTRAIGNKPTPPQEGEEGNYFLDRLIF
ncbi:hypothetical protein GCG54_00015305 [Colletotrichum gloeosporioides]|uniref:Uncharacterized protein n=1 Tax=Colletotrichum gloeosporioides TaxID=474922 RepID=A0A8H4C8K3_COLGL|nr:uncharacterized protein GCG54_00015305 [Colletotrichum gloeosporioides]KAF3799124.1 hypothetical protein GCG54_00015305 [Colletotrichum gloeosporioides]